MTLRDIRVAVALIRARMGTVPPATLHGECSRCLIGSRVWRSHDSGRGILAALYNWAVRGTHDGPVQYLTFMLSPIHACPNTTRVMKHW